MGQSLSHFSALSTEISPLPLRRVPTNALLARQPHSVSLSTSRVERDDELVLADQPFDNILLVLLQSLGLLVVNLLIIGQLNNYIVGVVAYATQDQVSYSVLRAENCCFPFKVQPHYDDDDLNVFTLLDVEMFFLLICRGTVLRFLLSHGRGFVHHHSILTHHSSSPHFSPPRIEGHLFTMKPDKFSPGYLTSLLHGLRFVDISSPMDVTMFVCRSASLCANAGMDYSEFVLSKKSSSLLILFSLTYALLLFYRRNFLDLGWVMYRIYSNPHYYQLYIYSIVFIFVLNTVNNPSHPPSLTHSESDHCQEEALRLVSMILSTFYYYLPCFPI